MSSANDTNGGNGHTTHHWDYCMRLVHVLQHLYIYTFCGLESLYVLISYFFSWIYIPSYVYVDMSYVCYLYVYVDVHAC